MNRPIRKLLAWTLALIMLIGMMPVDAVAAIIKTDTSNAVKIGNIVPMRIISPVEATHTYEFQVPNAEGTGFEIWGTQIVKNSEKLIEPAAPELTKQKFISWSAQMSLAFVPIKLWRSNHRCSKETQKPSSSPRSLRSVLFVSSTRRGQRLLFTEGNFAPCDAQCRQYSAYSPGW